VAGVVGTLRLWTDRREGQRRRHHEVRSRYRRAGMLKISTESLNRADARGGGRRVLVDDRQRARVRRLTSDVTKMRFLPRAVQESAEHQGDKGRKLLARKT
jgi:hypothetical protein